MTLLRTPIDPGTDTAEEAVAPDFRRRADHADHADHARSLAERIVRPSVAARDREGRWDPALFLEIASSSIDPGGPGLAGALVPRDLGGAGMTAVQLCALLDGLGEGSRDPGFTLAVAVRAALVTVPVRVFGDDRIRARLLPRMASGEQLGGLSLLQTQGGAAGPAVAAREVSGGWVLDGDLDLVALGPVAGFLLVIAAHENGRRSAFLVERATPGLSVYGAAPPAMPTRPWGRVVFEGCFVAAGNLLGSVGDAAAEVEPLLATLDWIFSAAPWLGLMRAVADAAGELALASRLFGRPLLSSQSTRFALADVAVRRELADGLLYRSAAALDSAGGLTRDDAAVARLFVAQTAAEVADIAVRLSGPGGSALRGDDHLMSRVHRDASFFVRTGGGTEVLRPVIADCLLNSSEGKG